MLFRKEPTPERRQRARSSTTGPGAPLGGTSSTPVNFTAPGWSARVLRELPAPQGNNTHAYTEPSTDDNVPQSGGEVSASSGPQLELLTCSSRSSTPAGGLAVRAPSSLCSWDLERRRTPGAERRQNAAQMFFFLGTFHDHLDARPIGFTACGRELRGRGRRRRAGQRPRRRQHGRSACPTATTSTTPTCAPRPTARRRGCRCTCSTSPARFPDEDPFLAANSGDEADVVYHEYTHGLSNRLVVDANGVSTLGGIQAGAMGEAWSDWYATDFLVQPGPSRTPPPPAMCPSARTSAREHLSGPSRYCPVGSTRPGALAHPAPARAGTPTATSARHGSAGGARRR